MLLRLVPKLSWLARISIAYIVGMMAGLKLYVYINSNILEQIQNSGIDFTSGFGNIINQVIILVGKSIFVLLAVSITIIVLFVANPEE